jgi:hypothetical protein
MEELLVIGFAIIFFALNLMLPVYLVYFIVGRYRAAKGKRETRPSTIRFALFLIACALAWSIAIPNYRKFPRTSSQSEAKTNLHAISMAQLSYFSLTNTYASGADAFQLMNWEPAGKTKYAYFCGSDLISNKLQWKLGYLRTPDHDWPVDLKPASSKTGFTCMAVGNVDNDEKLDVWSINDAKNLVNEQSDI